MDLLDALTADRSRGFLRRYPVELYYEQAPALEGASLRDALARIAPQVAFERQADGLPVRLTLAAAAEGATPTWELERQTRPFDPEAGFQVLEQSWSWPRARDAVARCRHVVRVVDDNVLDLDHRRRIELLQRIVTAILDVAPAVAVHWLPTQQLLEPVALRAAWLEDEFTSPLPGAINVRFYRIEGQQTGGPDETDYLMDTLGLAAVGLDDLQCHFRGLSPEEVGPILYETALYLWDGSGVLGPEDTVQGPRPDDRWSCRPEVSIAPPERDVIDLDPGHPFGAGEPVTE